MGTSNSDLTELNSVYSRAISLSLPNVKRITDVRQFMAESKSFNGSVEKLMEFIVGQEKQCQDVTKLLEEQVHQKMHALHQLKEDMLELQRQLNTPDAARRCHKMRVKFTEETEISECDVAEALVRYSITMSSLYCGILELDSDVDYANYLANIASVNKEFVQNWCKREKLNKSKISAIRI
ncbi:hypothetical protein ACLKA6_006813 [Drosophila palustris]